MAQLNDTMVQGDLRVTGKIYGTDNAICLDNANLAIPPIGAGDYVGSTGDFFIGSGSGKNLPDTTNNFNIHTTVTHFTGTTYRLAQIATPTAAPNPTGIYERCGSSSDGITWTFGSWATYNNYTLPVAASGTRGGIQIGYSESGTNYAVKLSSEKAYVSVPWTDTKVTQTKDDSGTTAYPLLMAGATNPNGTATTSRYDSGVKLTPSTNTISANISGNAATATKATQDSDGNTINATYFKSSGNVTLVSGTATKIGTQNGTDVKLTLPSESDPVFSASPAAGITSDDITTWNDALPKESWDFSDGSSSRVKTWNGLTRTAAVRIANSPKPTKDSTSPEDGNMYALTYANDSQSFLTQMAFGYTPYYRYRHNVNNTPTWTSWENVVTSDSFKKIVKDTVIGTDENTLYVLI